MALLQTQLFATLALAAFSVAQTSITNTLRPVAAELAGRILESGRKTVAVTDFANAQQCVSEFGRFLAEELQAALVGEAKSIQVIDRTHLHTLLRENKLGTSGVIDQATATKLGKVVGVNVLITGTITVLGDSVRVSMKALDAETAAVLTQTSVEIAKTAALDSLLQRNVGNCAGQPASPGAPAESPKVRPDEQLSDGFRFRLRSCGTAPGGLICDLAVTQEQQDIQAHVGLQARVVDGDGNECQISRRLLAGRDFGSVHRFLRDVPTALRLEFIPLYGPRCSVSGTHLRALEVAYAVYPDGVAREGRVVFRDVPLKGR